MNIGVISVHKGDTNHLTLCIDSQKEYCKKHRYKYLDEFYAWDDSRPYQWGKILAIQQYLPCFDWVLWIDSDVLIRDLDKDLETIIASASQDIKIILCKDCDPKWIVNTGVMLIKNDQYILRLLSEWYCAIGDSITYDQKAFIDIYNKEEILQQCTQILDFRKFGSFPKPEITRLHRQFPEEASYVPGDFYIHFVGGTKTSDSILRHSILSNKKQYDKRIAIVLRGSWGDVISTTMLLYNIKTQRNWHVTYFTNKQYASALQNNKHVDTMQIDDIPESLAYAALITDQFDIVNVPIIPPDRARFHDPLHLKPICWMWHAANSVVELGLDFSMPYKTFLWPTDDEYSITNNFINNLNLNRQTKCFMIEGGPRSVQSFWTPEWTTEICRNLLNWFRDCRIFISQGDPIYDPLRDLVMRHESRLYYCNDKSLREMSILFNMCHAFFSFSSGTANTCLTHKCKRDILWFEATKSLMLGTHPIQEHTENHYFLHNDLGMYINLIKERLHERHLL